MTQHAVDQKLKMTTQTHDALSQKYKVEYKKIVDSSNTPFNFLQNLLILDANYSNELASLLYRTHQQLERANNNYSAELFGHQTNHP